MQADRGRQFNKQADGVASIGKPAMLGLTTAIVVGIVMPLLAPHLGHPSMVFHATLHLASLSIAAFLSIVSVLAYWRARGARMFFMMLGFTTLSVVEFLYLLDAAGLLSIFSIRALGIELPHVILLAMLAMFGLGVLKVNNT